MRRSFWIGAAVWAAVSLSAGASAQINDSFDDGDFTANPAWAGSAGWEVASGVVRVTDAIVGVSTRYLSTPSTVAYGSWTWVMDDGTTGVSDINHPRFYLTSDIADLTGAVDGYAVRFGESDPVADVLKLVRYDNGVATDIVTTTYVKPQIPLGSTLRVRVTRDGTGLFTVYADEDATEATTEVGSGTDNTHTTSAFAGPYAALNNPATSRLYQWDDIVVTGLPPDTTAPAVLTAVPAADALVNTLASVTITFDEDVTGVVAGDLTVAGDPATNVTGSGAGPYTFTGYPAPPQGTVAIALGAGAIEDAASNAFAGHSYNVEFDSVAPTVVSVTAITTPRNTAVGEIVVTFSEPVLNFDDDVALTRDINIVDTSSLTVTPGAGNTYTIDLTALTAQHGAYLLTVPGGGHDVTDAAGNALITPGFSSWLTDTLAPGATVTTPPAVGFVGTEIVIPFSVTNPAQVFTPASNPVAVELLVEGPAGGGLVDSGLVPVSDEFTYTAASSGQYRFQVVASDPAGNVQSGATIHSSVVNIVPNGAVTLPLDPPPGYLLFPMETGLSSIVVQYTGTDPGAEITVQRFTDLTGLPPTLNGALLVAERIVITGTGLGASPEFAVSWNYAPDNIGAVAVERIFRYNGNTFVEGIDVTPAGDSVTFTVDGFSTFYLGDGDAYSSSVADWTVLDD